MHTSNKKDRELEEMVRGMGCVITGANNDVEVHHVKGRTYKHNKTLIGNVYMLPLHKDYHMVTGSHPNAYHKNKNGFIDEFGDPRELFEKFVLVYLIVEHQDKNIVGDYITEDQLEAIRTCPL